MDVRGITVTSRHERREGREGKGAMYEYTDDR